MHTVTYVYCVCFDEDYSGLLRREKEKRGRVHAHA